MYSSRWCQSFILFALPLFCRVVLAVTLHVSPDSTCASTCRGSDIPLGVCADKDLDSSENGRELQACINCLQTSTSVTGPESDLYWFVYNLRYTIDECLFSPQNDTKFPSSTCAADSECGGLRASFESETTLNSTVPELKHCVAGGSAFHQQIGFCSRCLRDNGQAYLSNFLVALDTGCSSKTSGSSLGIKGALFSTETVTAASSPTNGPAPSSDTLTTVTVVTISAGSTLLIISIAALIFMYCRRRAEKASKRKTYQDYPPKDAGSKGYQFPYFSHTETNALIELGTRHGVTRAKAGSVKRSASSPTGPDLYESCRRALAERSPSSNTIATAPPCVWSVSIALIVLGNVTSPITSPIPRVPLTGTVSAHVRTTASSYRPGDIPSIQRLDLAY
ncbi:hypothetical protein B0H63DRAFT_525061 [Podospora didyma]|uniref:LPXTG-domain-containing protein n=1 Tax=Podospora didyma TaxID=330526 RepID=A0AAE0KKL3_9PEZI|nr:hypothetical protein B0H63DRAFT_525061 [Podospora didyma]